MNNRIPLHFTSFSSSRCRRSIPAGVPQGQESPEPNQTKHSVINNGASFRVGVQTLDFGKSSYSWTAGVTNVARLSKVESIGLKYAPLFMSLCLTFQRQRNPRKVQRSR